MNKSLGGATRSKSRNKRSTSSSDINPLNGKPFSAEYYRLNDKLASLPANDPQVVKELKRAVIDHDLVIVQAETGAGKSVSVVPNILRFFNFERKIICTQPRSLNTETAKFVAQILDDQEEKYVNYAYRYQAHVTKDTILSYETDGRVLNYFYNDPDFKFGDILVIDEVHEKNPNIEFLLLFMKRILLEQNSNKKLVIMSATLDINYYQRYFNGISTAVVEIPGRTYPVESIFLNESLDLDRDQYVSEIRRVIVEIVNQQREPGDILVFIPAIAQIVRGCRQINQELQAELRERVVCLTLYRGITEDQKELIQDATKYRSLPGHPVRKIVFSTNIAESGVTIDGIKFVIDTGLAYNQSFDSVQRINLLRKQYISKFEIEQRKGRAGRTAPGTCYHLYTRDQYESQHLSKPSELSTMNLDYLVMDLLKSPLISQVSETVDFFSELIEPPSQMQLHSTFRYLKELNVIDSVDDGRLTELGKCLHFLNVEVGVGIALLVSDHFDVVWPVIRVAAMLSVESNISKWFKMPYKKDERRFKEVLEDYRGSYTDLQTLHKLLVEYRQAKDRQVWAKNRFLNLHLFKKADREASRLYQRYKQVPDRCKIESNVDKSGDQNKNLVLAFLHGFYNQILTSVGRDEYRNLEGLFVKVRPGRYNSLSKLKEVIVYMEMSDVMGRLQANGLINVTDPKVLKEIAPHFAGLDRFD